MALPNKVAYKSTMYPGHVRLEVSEVEFSTYDDAEYNHKTVKCEAIVRVFCPLDTHDAGFFASAKNIMEIVINKETYVLIGNIITHPDFHVLACTIDCSIHDDGAYYTSVFDASVSVYTTEDLVDTRAGPSNHLYLMKRPSGLSCDVQGWKVTCIGATSHCFDLRFKEDKPKGRAKVAPARTLMDKVWVMMFFKVCFALFVASILNNLPKQSLLVFVFFALIAYLNLELFINKYWGRMFPIPEAVLGVKRLERLDVLMEEVKQECARSSM
jgi:hypothetical protein